MSDRFPITTSLEYPKIGFIDSKGNVIIEPEYPTALPFSEGLSAVSHERSRGSQLPYDPRVQYLDEDGEVALDIPSTHTASSFNSGLASIGTRDANGEIESEYFAYINKKGKVEITGPFNEAHDFSEELAFVKYLDGYSHEDGAVQGFINTKGEMVVPIDGNIESVGAFSEGFAGIRRYMPQMGNKTAIYFAGKEHPIRTQPFERARSFSEGLAAVSPVPMSRPKREKWGYIDYEGNMAIEPMYTSATSFSHGLACVSVRKDGEFGEYDSKDYFFIDKNGNRAIDETFEHCIQFHENGLAGVEKDSKVGYIDTNGDFIVPLSEDYELNDSSMIQLNHSQNAMREERNKYKGELLEATLLREVETTMFGQPEKDVEKVLVYLSGEGNIIYQAQPN